MLHRAFATSSDSVRRFSFRSGGRRSSRGFTFIETLIAITILLVAITGPMTIAARGLQSAFFAREQITAFYLAQEGAEFARAVRDNNALAGSPWLQGLGACNSANGCKFDMRNPSSVTACAANNCLLKYDSGTLSGSGNRGFYNYSTGDDTQFTRRMWITQIVPDREAEVTVEVSWPSSLFNSSRSVKIQTRLFYQYDAI